MEWIWIETKSLVSYGFGVLWRSGLQMVMIMILAAIFAWFALPAFSPIFVKAAIVYLVVENVRLRLKLRI